MFKRSQSSAQAFLQSAGAKLGIIGVNAATGILTARELEPAGRGELSALMLWYVFLASTLTFGVPSALTFRLRKSPEQSSDLTGAAVFLALISSAIAILIGMIGIPYWMPQYTPSALFWARVFLFNTPTASLVLIGRAAVESRGDFTSSNLSLLGPPLLTLAGLVALLVLRQFTPVNAAWCYVLGGLPFLFLLGASYYKAFHPRIRNLSATLRMLLSYGMRSYGIDLCGTMALYVDQALVIRILDPAQMGSYVVALSLSRMLNSFHAAVAMILFPRAVSQSPDAVRELTGKAVRMTTMITVPAGALIILFGPTLLTLLYGNEYRPATTILRILVVEVILAGITQVLSQAFMALGRPGVITTLQVLGLGMTVPLMLILVPRMGISAAALSLLLSTLARLAFVLWSFPSFLQLPVPNVFPKNTDFQLAKDTLLHLGRFARTAEGEA